VETGTPWDDYAFDPEKALARAGGQLRPGTTTERDRIRRATANAARVAVSPYTSSPRVAIYNAQYSMAEAGVGAR
jgi:hypothetical protein